MKTQLVRFFLKIISATLIKAELYLEILLVNMHVRCNSRKKTYQMLKKNENENVTFLFIFVHFYKLTIYNLFMTIMTSMI
jgi:hypothetical protein